GPRCRRHRWSSGWGKTWGREAFFPTQTSSGDSWAELLHKDPDLNMDPFYFYTTGSGAPRWKISLTFSLGIHLALVLLIFFFPLAKKESGTPFVTRLVTPDELRREFPAEPPVKGSPKGSLRSRERAPAQPAVPRMVRPRREASPARSLQPVPRAT